jgi:hypothetical protein
MERDGGVISLSSVSILPNLYSKISNHQLFHLKRRISAFLTRPRSLAVGSSQRQNDVEVRFHTHKRPQ